MDSLVHLMGAAFVAVGVIMLCLGIVGLLNKYTGNLQ